MKFDVGNPRQEETLTPRNLARRRRALYLSGTPPPPLEIFGAEGADLEIHYQYMGKLSPKATSTSEKSFFLWIFYVNQKREKYVR